MDFLYQEAIAQNHLTDCPPATYMPIDRMLFRAVFPEGDSGTVKEFLPIALSDPKRLDAKKLEQEKCELFALSFFKSEFEIRRHLTKFKKLGTHIAEIKVSEDDGIASDPPREDGHVDFHPSATITWNIINLIEFRP